MHQMHIQTQIILLKKGIFRGIFGGKKTRIKKRIMRVYFQKMIYVTKTFKQDILSIKGNDSSVSYRDHSKISI